MRELEVLTRGVWQQFDMRMLPTAPTHPTHPTPAAVADKPLVRNSELGLYTNFVNLLGLAAVAVPAGFTPQGLPFGVTFVAPGGSDAALLFNSDLMSGDRFSALELAQQIRVSRMPLRQALQRLQREGFMQVFPKIGWLVVPLDFDQFDELYDFRVLIECSAVRHLCEADERPSLKARAEVWLVPVGEREPQGQRMGELDEAFHPELVAACGNRETHKAHRDLTERIRIIRRLDFTQARRVDVTYQ